VEGVEGVEGGGGHAHYVLVAVGDMKTPRLI
jgi:hypothetical protein